MRRVSRKTFVVALLVGTIVGAAIPMAVATIANQGTYTLSDFSIVYPYEDFQAENASLGEQTAQVTFVAHWPSGGFPGGASCQLLLSSADGTEVGRLQFDLVSGTDGVITGPVVVSVSGSPTSAAGSCQDAPDEVSTGVGYVFIRPTIASAIDPVTDAAIPDFTQLTFDVTWHEPGSDPGLRTCYLVTLRTDGTQDLPVKYNVLAGPGQITFDVKGAPETVAGGTVTCGPFEA